MATRTAVRYPFEPDFAVAPGETLLENIESLSMSQAELAVRAGLSAKTVNQIVQGKAPITPETAIRLERVTGTLAHFWLNLEAAYRAQLSRHEESRQLEEQLEWLASIPVRELLRRGAIEPAKNRIATLRAVLTFFGVSSVETWNDLWLSPSAAFRKSKAFRGKPGAIAAWLRLGELQAHAIQCEPYDKARFEAALGRIRRLTAEPLGSLEPKLRELCAASGVALVIVREIPGAAVSGATRWLSPDKALIQLSLRYKSDDQFWFSFYHEAGHILRHGKKLGFIEDEGADSDLEDGANAFAASFLIPREHEPRLGGLKSTSAIIEFSKALGIAPGIVVGRLQRDKVIPFSHCQHLKRRFEWKAAAAPSTSSPK